MTLFNPGAMLAVQNSPIDGTIDAADASWRATRVGTRPSSPSMRDSRRRSRSATFSA
jgi:hypothetical protein